MTHTHVLHLKAYSDTALSSQKDFDSSVGFKVGYTAGLQTRIAYFKTDGCPVDVCTFRTFPHTPVTVQQCEKPLGFVFLLEMIIHSILKANQYDFICGHSGKWITHTEYFWFKACQGDEAPFKKTKAEIRELLDLMITPWMNAVRDWDDRFYTKLYEANE